jgi:hypothetical protein
LTLAKSKRNHFGKGKKLKDLVTQAEKVVADIEFKGRRPERTKRQFISKLLLQNHYGMVKK